MTRPSREQIEAARAWFDEERLQAITDAGFTASADKIGLLLSATASLVPEEKADGPPTSLTYEELAEEVARRFGHCRDNGHTRGHRA